MSAELLCRPDEVTTCLLTSDLFAAYGVVLAKQLCEALFDQMAVLGVVNLVPVEIVDESNHDCFVVFYGEGARHAAQESVEIPA